MVVVKIDEMYLISIKVIEDAAKVEVHGDVSGNDDGPVCIEDRIQDGELLCNRQAQKARIRRRRIRAFVGPIGRGEYLTLHPGIDQRESC